MEEYYPEHILLGEEDVEWGKDLEVISYYLYFMCQAINAVADKEWIWIVDPVDGTTNYVYSLPLSVVSICVAQHVFIF